MLIKKLSNALFNFQGQYEGICSFRSKLHNLEALRSYLICLHTKQFNI